MKKNKRLFFPPLAVLSLACCMPAIVHAEVESNVHFTMELEKSPIDARTTRDGRWAYILTPGEVQVYALNTGALSGRIPVDKAISRISVSSNGDKLFLLNKKTKTVVTLGVAFFNMFTVADSPFKGPVDAPVVIVDFSDYQTFLRADERATPAGAGALSRGSQARSKRQSAAWPPLIASGGHCGPCRGRAEQILGLP
jgi:hypothetical protein